MRQVVTQMAASNGFNKYFEKNSYFIIALYSTLMVYNQKYWKQTSQNHVEISVIFHHSILWLHDNLILEI